MFWARLPITEITSPKVLNALANHPNALPFVAPGCDSVDLSGFFDRAGNVAFWSPGVGAILFAPIEDDTYEMHYLMPLEATGKQRLDAAKAILTKMFTSTGCAAIYGEISSEHTAARFLTRALGAQSTEVRGSNKDGVVAYILTRSEWLVKMIDGEW